jgi:predicted metal-binding membrane protein
MTNTRTEAVRRARASFFVLSGLVFVVSASATIFFRRSMSGRMDMPGDWMMSMMWMRMSGQTRTASAAMFLLMWLAMMVAMMLPRTPRQNELKWDVVEVLADGHRSLP